MPQHVVLLRGINLVRRNRIAMPELRSTLEGAGFRAVKTHLQSGNVILTSRVAPERVAREVHRLILGEFGFDIAVLVRSRVELAEVVARNPLRKVAVDPKRHLVTFLSRELPADLAARLRATGAEQEVFSAAGREIYSWHPAGFARSPLWERLAARSLGIEATSRNWTTVTTLLAMAQESSAR
jgi:uncharacterized protein (DUF1697 family)